MQTKNTTKISEKFSNTLKKHIRNNDLASYNNVICKEIEKLCYEENFDKLLRVFLHVTIELLETCHTQEPAIQLIETKKNNTNLSGHNLNNIPITTKLAYVFIKEANEKGSLYFLDITKKKYFCLDILEAYEYKCFLKTYKPSFTPRILTAQENKTLKMLYSFSLLSYEHPVSIFSHRLYAENTLHFCAAKNIKLPKEVIDYSLQKSIRSYEYLLIENKNIAHSYENLLLLTEAVIAQKKLYNDTLYCDKYLSDIFYLIKPEAYYIKFNLEAIKKIHIIELKIMDEISKNTQDPNFLLKIILNNIKKDILIAKQYDMIFDHENAYAHRKIAIEQLIPILQYNTIQTIHSIDEKFLTYDLLLDALLKLDIYHIKNNIKHNVNLITIHNIFEKIDIYFNQCIIYLTTNLNDNKEYNNCYVLYHYHDEKCYLEKPILYFYHPDGVRHKIAIHDYKKFWSYFKQIKKDKNSILLNQEQCWALIQSNSGHNIFDFKKKPADLDQFYPSFHIASALLKESKISFLSEATISKYSFEDNFNQSILKLNFQFKKLNMGLYEYNIISNMFLYIKEIKNKFHKKEIDTQTYLNYGNYLLTYLFAKKMDNHIAYYIDEFINNIPELHDPIKNHNIYIFLELQEISKSYRDDKEKKIQSLERLLKKSDERNLFLVCYRIRSNILYFKIELLKEKSYKEIFEGLDTISQYFLNQFEILKDRKGFESIFCTQMIHVANILLSGMAQITQSEHHTFYKNYHGILLKQKNIILNVFDKIENFINSKNNEEKLLYVGLLKNQIEENISKLKIIAENIIPADESLDRFYQVGYIKTEEIKKNNTIEKPKKNKKKNTAQQKQKQPPEKSENQQTKTIPIIEKKEESDIVFLHRSPISSPAGFFTEDSLTLKQIPIHGQTQLLPNPPNINENKNPVSYNISEITQSDIIPVEKNHELEKSISQPQLSPYEPRHVFSMKNTNPFLKTLCQTADQHKTEIFLTGGTPRDILLHRTPRDYDILWNATRDTVEGILAELQNKDYAFTFKKSQHVQDLITMRYHNAPYDINCKNTFQFTLQHLLDYGKTRDFTINTFFAKFNINTEYWDVYETTPGGLKHLHNHMLYKTSSWKFFEEDPRRFWRGILSQFSNNFLLSEKFLKRIISDNATPKLLHEKSSHTYYIKKLFSMPKSHDIYMFFIKTKLLERIFPTLYNQLIKKSEIQETLAYRLQEIDKKLMPEESRYQEILYIFSGKNDHRFDITATYYMEEECAHAFGLHYNKNNFYHFLWHTLADHIISKVILLPDEIEAIQKNIKGLLSNATIYQPYLYDIFSKKPHTTAIILKKFNLLEHIIPYLDDNENLLHDMELLENNTNIEPQLRIKSLTDFLFSYAEQYKANERLKIQKCVIHYFMEYNNRTQNNFFYHNPNNTLLDRNQRNLNFK